VLALAAGAVALAIFALWSGTKLRTPETPPPESTLPAVADIPTKPSPRRFSPDSRPPARGLVSEAEAKQIVAEKLARFARQRRDLARLLAEKLGDTVTPQMEQFFTAAETGDWEQLEALTKELFGRRMGGEGHGTAPPNALRQVLLETRGVVEVAHKWPAAALLDYGRRILDSLDPGMIYVGGTDPGRFIPTLLNETGDGPRRIILTQNRLADRTYLDYVNFLYGDQLSTLTTEDSDRAFRTYLEDATKRAQHDQQFPNEPRQVAHNEDIKIQEGRVQVSGPGAVMKINGLLLQTLMAQNPDARFALEESFPIESTYVGASPRGPLIYLNALSDGAVMPAETAQQTLDYWQTTVSQVLADPAWSESVEVRNAYAKLVEGQANLLGHQGFTSAAEQLYAVARQLAPDAPGPVEQFAIFLSRQGRQTEALQVLDTFLQAHPQQQTGLLELRRWMLGTLPSGP
jgi:hypothetical protein